MNKNISSEFLHKIFNEALDNIKNNYFVEALNKFENLNLYKKNDPEILSLISFCHYNLKNYIKAEEYISKAIAFDPNKLGYYINKGNILKGQKKIFEAEKIYLESIKLFKNSAKLYYNLGILYFDQHKYDLAIRYYKKSLLIDSKNKFTLNNIGSAFKKLGNFKKCKEYYQSAILIDPFFSEAQHNLSFLLLYEGQFIEGWSKLESRKKALNIKKILNIPKTKIWDGKQFNSTLVIHAEQGVGDEILISSLYNELFNIQKNLCISCDKRLIKIFERSFLGIEFVDRKSSFTFSNESKHIFSFSLGQYLRTNVKSFNNNSKKWLYSNYKRDKEIQNLIPNSNKIKIGISWKSPSSKQDNKDISLLKMISIMPKNFFELINLQYGNIKDDEEEIWKKAKRKFILFKNIDYKNDFDSLISLIMNCDAIVTSDNVTAHFAGALGKKTFLLVPINAFWYWQTKKTKSIWYPNICIYRQSESKNWDMPINLLKSDLIDLYKMK
jgi:Flp pilus assembly protein TadD|tara:strand:- start:4197 stop:5687 length:1491 start_codon:yes stop_codon:yes gene_type:complete